MLLADVPVGKYILWSPTHSTDTYLITEAGMEIVAGDSYNGTQRLVVTREEMRPFHWVTPTSALFVVPCDCPRHERLGLPTFHQQQGEPIP